MAAIVAKSASAAGVVAKPTRVSRVAAPKVFAGLKKVAAPKNVQPTEVAVSHAASFHVWQPVNNKMFETFSYLPPLSDSQIADQVNYIVQNGWVPCLEFSPSEIAYTSNTNTVRMGGITPCYYDNRYWTMWKLPMFGCTDASQVLKEISLATKAFPDCYVRIVAFDNQRQVQCMGFLVQKPRSAKDWKGPEERSVNGTAPTSSW